MRHVITTALACIIGVALTGSLNSQAATQTFEDASKTFVQTYMERWSAANAEALAFMNSAFLDKAVYFNRTLDHAALMQAKRRFAERWPVRRFVVRTDALSASCDQRHLCTVWGLVDWLCRSPERQAEATGTSVFAFQVQDAQVVLDEDGFVIARGQMLSRHAGASVPSTRTYSNADIARLRRAFYNDSTDPNWIAKWLAAREPFSGVAQSMGQASARQLTDSDGSQLRYAVFQSDQGSIACMTKDAQSMPTSGAVVHLRGTVAIFIDETMYLSGCSFS